MRGASYSKGGLSFIVAQSTAAHGKVSRIVPRLQGPATDPRLDMQYVATEHGLCNLRGKSSAERALTLIGVAICHLVGVRGWWQTWMVRLPAPVVGFSYSLALTLALMLAPASGKAFIYFQF